MRKVFLIAALMLSTSVAAHAGDSWSFNVNGQRVKIERPRNCNSLSCINIVAPGLSNSSSDDSSTANTTPVAPTQNNQAVATAPVQQQIQQPAQQQQVYQQPIQAPVQQAPVAVAPVQPSQVTAPVPAIPPLPGQNPAPAGSNVTTLPAPTTQVEPQQTVAAPATNQVATVAPTPVQPQAQQPVQQVLPQQKVATVAPTAPAATGPVGMWMTEKNEGKVHVVQCGANMCGYAVDKNGADGAQVLINMKPTGDSWHGRIHDTRSGGTYDSTIAMRGNDKMRVQGCAFGGMFCGGQTWTRAN